MCALCLLTSLVLPASDLFRQENLVAWCVVPFDARQRGPEERMAMLKKLGFTRYAYDWREQHLPTFEQELQFLRREGIKLQALWFPATLDKHARFLLDALRRQGVMTELWVSPAEPRGRDDAEKARAIADALRPVVTAAERQGCRVALYNHGGWAGEPKHQLAVLRLLDRPAVGVVYNLHHGHAHLDRFPEVLALLQPHLTCVNLNGMIAQGDQRGQKILPLGAGDHDLRVLQALVASGYRGPVGILGHTQDDVELRLRDNLDGLIWLRKQLQGEPANVPPAWRTWKK